MTNSEPLVSVGLPTRNRVAVLRRAVESVLAQQYSNLELLISDNDSTDETEAVCAEFQQRDGRVRYSRQQINRGPIANFRAVLKEARGELFMWLGDDDWLDCNYISQCVQFLTDHPEYSLVCGSAKYFRDGNFLFQGETINLPQSSGQDRVLAYYKQVLHNGTFHGLSRRGLLELAPLHNTVGADWLLVASMAFMGKVGTIDEALIYRALGGATRDMKSMIDTMEMSRLQGRLPHMAIAISAVRDIVTKSPAYESLGRTGRYALAMRVLLRFFRRFVLGYWYHLSYPYWSRPILYGLSIKHKLLKKS